MIREAFAAPDVGIEIHNWPPGSADGDAEFQFRPDTLLTSDTTADAVAEDLGANFAGFDARESPIRGLTVFRVQPRAADEMLDLVESINDRLGPSTVTLDHVLHISAASCCPAKEPVPVTGVRDPHGLRPDPEVTSHSAAGAGVKVAVVDTGWLTQVGAQHDWLGDVTGEQEGPNIGHYTGHGTFVAGVLRTMAPECEVKVHALFPVGGAVTESEIAPLLVDVLATQPQIISMSAGTRTIEGEVLHGLQAFRDNYLSQTDTLLVCAAGNDGDQGPFAPASLGWPEAVSVGALNRA
ncbi:MAG TPA: S8/S53 family peptidase, partial [Humibacillus xanthopallidus]|nr:S8/S53 family peptidase [Humibacillus xanthopallidus]